MATGWKTKQHPRVSEMTARAAVQMEEQLGPGTVWHFATYKTDYFWAYYNWGALLLDTQRQ